MASPNVRKPRTSPQDDCAEAPGPSPGAGIARPGAAYNRTSCGNLETPIFRRHIRIRAFLILIITAHPLAMIMYPGNESWEYGAKRPAPLQAQARGMGPLLGLRPCDIVRRGSRTSSASATSSSPMKSCTPRLASAGSTARSRQKVRFNAVGQQQLPDPRFRTRMKFRHSTHRFISSPRHRVTGAVRRRDVTPLEGKAA